MPYETKIDTRMHDFVNTCNKGNLLWVYLKILVIGCFRFVDLNMGVLVSVAILIEWPTVRISLTLHIDKYAFNQFISDLYHLYLIRFHCDGLPK